MSEPYINSDLLLIIMYKFWLTKCNKLTHMLIIGETEERKYFGTFYFPLGFPVNLKWSKKKKIGGERNTNLRSPGYATIG